MVSLNFSSLLVQSELILCIYFSVDDHQWIGLFCILNVYTSTSMCVSLRYFCRPSLNEACKL